MNYCTEDERTVMNGRFFEIAIQDSLTCRRGGLSQKFDNPATDSGTKTSTLFNFAASAESTYSLQSLPTGN